MTHESRFFAPISATFLPSTIERINDGFVQGFLHLWAVYVRGFDPRHHCQRCLRGPLTNRITTVETPVEREIVLDETPNFCAIYICGVARGKVRDRPANNLHLPLRNVPGLHFEYNTYNGYKIQLRNAELLSIPRLPDWWMGYPPASSRCCNFRFCVGFFGPPEPLKGSE